MIDFFVGQKVVCVDDTGLICWPEMKAGNVYTISAIGPYGDSIHVDVAEVKTRIPLGWRHDRFRPVRTTDITIFTAMLAPTPRVKQLTN